MLQHMEIWFPAYRRHDRARIRASDAMMALLASSRLATERLSSVGEPEILLPQAFPDVADLHRMNRSVRDSTALIERAEREFVFMAIPYTLSVHQAFIVDCIRLVQDETETDSSAQDALLRLEVIHDRFIEVSGQQLPADLRSLFQLLRHLRNRIVHYAAVQGSHLREKWLELPPPAVNGWTKVAGRALPVGRSADEMDLRLGELLAALMTVTRLGREVSAAMGAAIEPERWRYDLKLWVGHLFDGAAYLPR
jgi:hypothetical protein